MAKSNKHALSRNEGEHSSSAIRLKQTTILSSESKNSKDNMQKLILKHIVEDIRPLSCVESPLFRAIVHAGASDVNVS